MFPIVKKPHAQNFVDWAKNRKEVLVMTADLTSSCEADLFRDTYPERYFSMGMAEQCMMSAAGGLARMGFTPFLHTFAVFLARRAFDQLAMSIAYPNLPVRLMGFLPGITTPGGVTHQAIDDIALMRTLPNMTIFECSDATEVESVLDATLDVPGPVYVRMLRGDTIRIFPKNTPFPTNSVRLLHGSPDDDAKIALLTSGICTEHGIQAVASLQSILPIRHIHVATLKPFPTSDFLLNIQGIEQIVVAENHSVIGGLGSIICEIIAENALPIRVKRLGLQDCYAHGASRSYLMAKYGIDANTIAQTLASLSSLKTQLSIQTRRDLVHSDAKPEAL